VGLKGYWGRIDAFQPTTWVVHLVVADLFVAVVDFIPFAIAALGLLAALGIYGWFEYRQYQEHRLKSHPAWVWLIDGIGDVVGPATAVFAYLADFWVAHTLGLLMLSLGTVAWVGLGYDGGGDAT